MTLSGNRMVLGLGLATAVLGGLAAGPSTATAADSHPYRIVNHQSGGSLTPHHYGGDRRDNSRIFTTNNHRTRPSDEWRLERVGKGFTIRNKVTGLCLEPSRNKQWRHKIQVVQGTCERGLSKFQWRLEKVGDHIYKVKSVSSHHVLAPSRDRPRRNGFDRAVMERDTGAVKQQWSIKQV